MLKDALEMIAFDVNDADATLFTRWRNGQATRLLVDGGRRSTAPVLKRRLRELGATQLDVVLCTHFDDDHAEGLVEIVGDPEFDIGEGWMHVVHRHAQPQEIKRLVKGAGIKEAERLITASVDTNQRLFDAFARRKITPVEPFAGRTLSGFGITVLGPSEAFYETFVQGLETSDSEAL